ncbi:MAG: DNA-formamidopyrimidine glycosylase [Chloroflexi bacterium]|nr:DNA-formamidopyrimidine glycosylase [Chloroflexota bacterium]
MPELPEVETLRRNLERTLVGRTFAEVEVRLPRLCAADTGLTPDALIGRRVLGLRRRAKFLIVDLSDGLSLVIHLRLAGQLVHRNREGRTLAEGGHPVPAFGAPLPHRSTHVIFRFEDGSILYVTDIRQFGRLWVLPTDAVEPLLARSKLGPEPLDPSFTVDVLRERIARRQRMPLKPLLLDQHVVGGVGNIYADEIIFASRLRPDTRVSAIDDAALERLHAAIQSVLGHAVREGVAEILNGKASPESDFPRVHGRASQPCPACGTAIVKTRFGGRGTYTCPTCQPGDLPGVVTQPRKRSVDAARGPRASGATTATPTGTPASTVKPRARHGIGERAAPPDRRKQPAERLSGLRRRKRSAERSADSIVPPDDTTTDQSAAG